MPKYKITAEYVGTCLPCYLTDSFTREGEVLLSIAPNGQSRKEAASELYNDMQANASDIFDESFYEQCSHSELEDLFHEALRGVDLRYIDGNGDRVSGVFEYEYECPYVYMVLRWTRVSETLS